MGPLPGRRQGIPGGLFAGYAPLWGLVQGRTRGAGAIAAHEAEPRPRRIRPAAAVTTGIATTLPPVLQVRLVTNVRALFRARDRQRAIAAVEGLPIHASATNFRYISAKRSLGPPLVGQGFAVFSGCALALAG